MKRPAIALFLVAIAAATLATRLFPRAFPILAITDRIDRNLARQRADAFLARHDLAPDSARRAIEFVANDSLRTFIELRGGGKDSLDALLRGHDVALYSWSVRAFVPGDAREARIRLSPDGRIIAVKRTLPDSLVRPNLDEVAARAIADSVVTGWLGESPARWTFSNASYTTRSPGGRVDRTFTWERRDRTIATAPLRLDVVIAGDLVAEANPYVVIPESFHRRYAEMVSANTLLGLFANVGVLVLFVVAMVALRRYARQHVLRWRPPVVIGAIGGVLVTAAMLNALPGSWAGYDTAGSPELHQLAMIALAIAGGAGTMLMLTLTLAAAEALTRQAFPWHLDWWRLWQHRGTREVAARVGGGYAAAAIGFAYVTTFYLITRGAFDWWVPSELIDDPNQIATPFPWLAGIGLSLQAAVSEEALFRAIPLSLVALWAAARPDRDRWMAAAVVGTALLFGFAHSTYPSWPPYSRGVEIFIEACVWGFLFLRFGILVPVIAHFAYDLVLFGLFATGGSGVPYRVSAGFLVLALTAPLLSVAWAWVGQGGWKPLGADAWFQAWSPAPRAAVTPPPPVAVAPRTTTSRARQVALIVPILAVIAAVTHAPSPVAGPAYTASRVRAGVVADSMLGARGGEPGAWRRLVGTGSDTVANWRRFLVKHKAESLATKLAADYAIPAWWVVRYVRPEAPLAERTEEWRLRVLPDGRPLDVRHIIPEEAVRGALPPDSVRQIAGEALRTAGYAATSLREVQFADTTKPARHDVTITYVDSSVALPAAATARAWVSVAGDEVLAVRRGVALPETFVREARREDEFGMAAFGVFGLPMFGILIWAIVRARRRPFVAQDDLSRRTVILLGLVLAVILLASSLQGIPAAMARYDTTMPWRTFITMTTGGQIMSLGGVLMMALFWFLSNGMRRRSGIPLVAGLTGGRTSEDLRAGLALGGISTALGLVGRLIERHPFAGSPGTMLDQAFPALGPVLGVIPGAIVVVLTISIPALALSGFDERRGPRLAIILLFLALLAGISVGGDRFLGLPSDLKSDIWTIISGGVTVLALLAWGGVSVLSWFMAATFMEALGALRAALQAPTIEEQLGRWIAVLLSLGLLVLGYLISRRPSAAPQSATGHSTNTVSESPR